MLPVAGYRAIDDARLQPARRRVIEPESAHDAGPEVLEQHIAACDQAPRRFQRGRLFQVERNRLLARVDRDERWRHAVIAPVVAVVAHGVAPIGRLDLDDLRTEQAEQMRRIRTRHDMAEVGNTNTFKRFPDHYLSHTVSCRCP